MDAIAGYADEDEEEAPAVTLDIGGGQEITSAAWCDLLEDQADESWRPALNDQSWVATMKPNEVVAFYDRVALDGPWRKAFVVCATDSIRLFDVAGDAVDESDSPGGVQPLDAFLDDWSVGFYVLARTTEELAVDDDDDVARSDDDDGDVEDALPAFIAAGKRIKMSIGVPAKWYGGLVEEDIKKAGKCPASRTPLNRTP